VKSPERRDWLKKAVLASHKTLAIDSEDFDAHYVLGQTLGDPAWANPQVEAVAKEEMAHPIETDALLALGQSIVDHKTTPGERKARALRLAHDVVRYMKGERPRYESRLEPLHDLAQMLGPVWERETDGDAQAAIGKALELTHKALHERLKPDETAEGRAFAAARQKDHAANINSQSIVIHSLHRPGAPGIDTAPVAAAASSPVPMISTPARALESGE
jgi:hypothetical protein